jgi:hypothetical protein
LGVIRKIFSFEFDEKRVTELFLHLSFFLIIILSYVYYLERTIPFDGAFYSFKLIFFENFNVENGRWGACYNQLLPILGVKLGLSLPSILKLYSVSFAFCSYIFFLIIYYGYKQTFTAIALLLTSVIAYRYNFYYQVSEIHAIIGPVFLLLATLLSQKFMEQQKVLGGILLIFFIFWLVNIHLLSIVIILFCLAFVLLQKPLHFRNIYFLGALVIGIVIFYLKLSSIPLNSYEAGKVISLDDIKYVFNNLTSINGYIYFNQVWWVNYLLPSIVLCLVLVFYLYKFQLLKFLLIALASAGLWILIIATGIKKDSPIVFENYYALFGYLIAIPLALDVLSKLSFKWFFPTLSILVFVSILQIDSSGKLLKSQIDYFTKTTNNLRAFKEQKFVLNEQNVEWERMWVGWDFPFQSLLISSLASPDSSITFFTTLDSSLYDKRIYSEGEVFIGPPFAPYMFDGKSLPKRYFNLGKLPYKKVNQLQDTSFHPEYFSNDNLELNLISVNYILNSSSSNILNIKLHNKSSRIFKSTTSKTQLVYLGCRFFDLKSKNFVSESRTILDLDVFPGHEIQTSLRIPVNTLKPGSYSVEVDIVDEQKRWFGLSKWFTLVVI